MGADMDDPRATQSGEATTATSYHHFTYIFSVYPPKINPTIQNFST